MIIDSKLKCYYITSAGVSKNPTTFTVTGRNIQFGNSWKGVYNSDGQVIWSTNNGMAKWTKISKPDMIKKI